MPRSRSWYGDVPEVVNREFNSRRKLGIDCHLAKVTTKGGKTYYYFGTPHMIDKLRKSRRYGKILVIRK